MDFHAVRKMTAEKLREELAKYPDLTGLTAKKKDELVDLYCAKLGIQKIVHGAATIDKTALKQAIRSLKKQRDAAMVAKDTAVLAEIHHQIHAERHKLRRAVKMADRAAAKLAR